MSEIGANTLGEQDVAALLAQNRRLVEENTRALERQAATAEILKVIASSPDDLQPVFDAIVNTVQRLMGAVDAAVTRLHGNQLHLVAITGTGGAADDLIRRMFPLPLAKSGPNQVALRERRVCVVEDTETDPDYGHKGRELGRLRGFRSVAMVPLVCNGEAIGTINVPRPQPGPFPPEDIALLESFAAQAVIAIRNVQALNETKQALEQQKASAEVLQVISSSVADATPVFIKIAESCLRLFGTYAVLSVVNDHGLLYHVAAATGNVVAVDPAEYAAVSTPAPDADTDPTGVDFLDARQGLAYLNRSYPRPPSAAWQGYCMRKRKVIDYPDMLAPNIPEGMRASAKYGNYSTLIAPMLWQGRAIGTIHLVRQPPRPATPKEMALLQTFADQAAIAIENARLFRETRESLEQQRASAEVLQAISGSMSDAVPVFDQIVESCGRLLPHASVGLNVVGDDGLAHMAAFHGEGRDEFAKVFPLRIDVSSATGRCISERRVIQFADVLNDPDVPAPARMGGLAMGARAAVFVPVVWEDRGLGAIFVGRREAGAFSEKEMELLRGFANQAAIAIQNTRLFNDTRRSLERQTATAEVLQVISSSMDDA
jgi:GAF domain-containing protein